MMAANLEKRLAQLEAHKAAVSGTWHRISWGPFQRFEDAIAEYGADRLRPGDNIMYIVFVEPGGLDCPVRTASKERQVELTAWMEGAGVKPAWL